MNLPSKIEAVDTCVLLRVLEGDIQEQAERALELLLSGRDFYITETVISEVVYVMTKEGYDRKEIAEKMKVLFDNPMFVYDRKFFEPVFKDYLKNPSLSFEDLIIAKRAEERECIPVWTFDRKFAKQMKVARLVG